MSDASLAAADPPSATRREVDAGFTLDAEQQRRRKSASARRVHALQVPLIRSVGFVALCLILLVHDVSIGAPVPTPHRPALPAPRGPECRSTSR